MHYRRGFQRLSFAFALVAFSGSLSAEITVKDYRRIMNSKDKTQVDVLTAYLSGLGSGFSWANARTIYIGRQPLYCQPVKLAVQTDNYIDILNRQINDEAAATTEADLAERFIEQVLLDGLQKTFPCPTK